MLSAPSHEQLSKSLLQILPHGTAIALSAFPPIQWFSPLTYVHISLLEKLSPPPLFLTVRCSMLPHNGEETLLPVTFPGVFSCFSEDILNSLTCPSHSGMCGSLLCPCSQNYLFISTERTVQLLDRGSFCASVTVETENRGSSKPNVLLKCRGVCELDLNIHNEHLKKLGF